MEWNDTVLALSLPVLFGSSIVNLVFFYFVVWSGSHAHTHTSHFSFLFLHFFLFNLSSLHSTLRLFISNFSFVDFIVIASFLSLSLSCPLSYHRSFCKYTRCVWYTQIHLIRLAVAFFSPIQFLLAFTRLNVLPLFLPAIFLSSFYCCYFYYLYYCKEFSHACALAK